MENKEAQKKLLTEVMEADAQDGLYKQQTAVEWLYKELYGTPRTLWEDELIKIFEKAKAMEQLEIYAAYETGWVNGDLKMAPRFGSEYFDQNYNK